MKAMSDFVLLTSGRLLPLYLDQRTSSAPVSMTQTGQKETFELS
jgi:hypothetical protein